MSVNTYNAIDITTAQRHLVFTIFALLTKFERDLIWKRAKAGLLDARSRGRTGEKPKGLSKEALFKAEAAKTLLSNKGKTVDEIVKLLGVS